MSEEELALLRQRIREGYLAPEDDCLQALAGEVRLAPEQAARVRSEALALAAAVRERLRTRGGFPSLLQEYNLSSEEGILLMSLAEALLRIPDAATADRLIRDKLSQGEWDQHLGHGESLMVTASTWGLLLTGRLLETGTGTAWDPRHLLHRLVERLGAPGVRLALTRAMRMLAGHFVLAPDLETALKLADRAGGLRYSFDCLGEAAVTARDARRYQDAYLDAIHRLAGTGGTGVQQADGISVKLSALHPRYEFAQRERVLAEMVPRVRELALAARDAGIGLTLDAEETDRLELMLDVFAAVWREPLLADWEGFGLAVQAYQRRCPAVLDWLAALAAAGGRRIPVRLVKGAYWDTEIKRAQEAGLASYPVFTRKAATDLAYLAGVARLHDHRRWLYGQFASHNAYTLAWVLERYRGDEADFELQRLHGMGEELQAELLQRVPTLVLRVYAPVGDYRDLLPYLVRRLLENGANSSFVNQLADPARPLDALVTDPLERLRAEAGTEALPEPPAIFLPERLNSRGLDLSDPLALGALQRALADCASRDWTATPLPDGDPGGEWRMVRAPQDTTLVVGRVREATGAELMDALARAHAAAPAWARTAAEERARCLERAAERLEAERAGLVYLLVREAGRCLRDALAEVREAVDFCRYYAAEARRLFGRPRALPGPVGERNEWSLHGRGVFLAISPWNFPLSIFLGQVTGALAAGNAVLAKPARATPLVAALAVRLLHEAGIPPEVVQLLPGPGAAAGERLLPDARLAGVVFTGSTDTARHLNRTLAARRGPIVPLIAETGGQNAMIVDSSALPEQVVRDVLTSAFDSAGQRCSALRVLFVQAEIADRLLDMLAGAMDELVLGDPMDPATDIGPVIDADAQRRLQAHVDRMHREGRLLKALALPVAAAGGTFFAPHLFEIEDLHPLTCEVFGPVLHLVRYPADGLDQVIDAINATGYGLTLGVHSRIEYTWQRVRERARVGNLYVNRNMIGAVVGVQPFGGEGLSGTGPKAGGPHYLPGFATERTFTVNTAALGGIARLLSGD